MELEKNWKKLVTWGLEYILPNLERYTVKKGLFAVTIHKGTANYTPLDPNATKEVWIPIKEKH